MQFRVFKRGDIIETIDGKLGIVSSGGVASISADLIVGDPGFRCVSGNPTEFTFIPSTKIEKEYLLRKGRLNFKDYI
jgi:hypothetical protein